MSGVNNYLYATNMGLQQRAAGAEAGLNDAVIAFNMAQTRIRELEQALSISSAHSIGLEAQLKEFIVAHPTSPVRADSGKRYKKTGNVKSMGRIAYEKAFDEAARKSGIANPVEHRAD